MAQIILIVEDSSDYQILVARILTNAGYQVAIANNGLEGLHYIEQHGAPDLIVSDVQMPELSGLEFLEELRRRPTTSDVRVLFMSCSLDARSAAYRLGAAGFVSKGTGFTTVELLAEVQRNLVH